MLTLFLSLKISLVLPISHSTVFTLLLM